MVTRCWLVLATSWLSHPCSEDRLLALRVEVPGATPAHSALASHAAKWTNEIRQIAIDAGACRVWVEKVVFRTSPPREPDGRPAGRRPLAELATYLDELRGDDARLSALGSTRSWTTLSASSLPSY